MSNNLHIWDKVKQPPIALLKAIGGGRLKGMTDINPQWRYQVMTEVFGVCGIGWKYEIVRLWTEPAPEGAVFAFAEIRLYTEAGGGGAWSEPIPATGGSMLIEKETKGLYANDEAFKMATTDALGTAMKMLGVAADIYLRNFDGTKYRNPVIPPETITETQAETLRKRITDTATDLGKFLAWAKIMAIGELPASRFEEAVKMLERKKVEEVKK